MTPSPTPSEGEAMLARVTWIMTLISRDQPNNALQACKELQEELRAAAQSSSGVRAQTIEECANIALAIDSGRGNEKEIAKAIRRLSPDTPREGE